MKNSQIPPNEYSDLDDFIKNLSSESKNKVYRIVNALLDESDLNNSNEIKVPFHKLRNFPEQDLMSILKSLYKINAAKTILEIRQFPGNEDKPGIGILNSILKDENIIYNKKATVFLRKNKLRYLQNKLSKKAFDTSKHKILLGTSLDEKNKFLIIETPKGKEMIGFKKKKIEKRNKKYDRNAIRTEHLDESENNAIETKLYKVFATYHEKRKIVFKQSSQKESLSDNAIPNIVVSQMLDISVGAVRNYQKIIREMIRINNLPMKLETDNKGNYQLFVRQKRI